MNNAPEDGEESYEPLVRNESLALRLNALFCRHTPAVFLEQTFLIFSGLSSTAASINRGISYFWDDFGGRGLDIIRLKYFRQF